MTEPAPGNGATEGAGIPEDTPPWVSLPVIAREWLRLGCIGFGGPPAHIALLRKLCVRDRGWLSEQEFEDGVATVNLLPGPASTQLTIYAAWRLRRVPGALIGGACFIVPGLIVILALAVVFLSNHPPGPVAAAALGAGSAVPAVALASAIGLIPASWRRAGARAADPTRRPAWPPRVPAPTRLAHVRWAVYLCAGGAATGLLGPWLVLVLAASGLIEVIVRSRAAGPPATRAGALLPAFAALRLPLARRPSLASRPAPASRSALAHQVLAIGSRLLAAAPAAAGLGGVAWVGFKVGALSYGGGFVIIPLMQHDAVQNYHWMTAPEFLTAVALGQVTPGPVVQTVAVLGYAAAGIGGGVLASAVAFTPSFCFVLGGGPYFGRLRRDARVQAFLTGAGPAAIGAIAGASIPLTLALVHLWQGIVLAGVAAWLIGLRRGVVTGIVGGALLGIIAFLAGAPVT